MVSKRVLAFCKVVVACVAVMALVSIPVHRIAPGLTLLQIAGLLFCAFVVLVLFAIASLTFWQFILRAGGTDTQWFWFPGEPPGLQGLRKQRDEDARRES